MLISISKKLVLSLLQALGHYYLRMRDDRSPSNFVSRDVLCKHNDRGSMNLDLNVQCKYPLRYVLHRSMTTTVTVQCYCKLIK